MVGENVDNIVNVLIVITRMKMKMMTEKVHLWWEANWL